VKPQKRKAGSSTWPEERLGSSTSRRATPSSPRTQGGGDVFVHYPDIEGAGFRPLEEGEKVTYEVTQVKKGMLAQNISKA
jgi:cold shock CspA family protein